MNDVYQTELRGLDRLSVRSILDYLTLKISYQPTIFTGTELTAPKFATYTKRIQKLNKLFPSLQSKGITFSLQHKLVTRVTLIIEEHEIQNESKMQDTG